MMVRTNALEVIKQSVEEITGSNLYSVELLWNVSTDPLPQKAHYFGVIKDLRPASSAAPFMPFEAVVGGVTSLGIGNGGIAVTLDTAGATATVGLAVTAMKTLAGLS